MAETIVLEVDGKTHRITVDDPNMPLLYALRDYLGLNNPHFGCGEGHCWACAVHLNGVATRSCWVSVAEANGGKVVTLNGLGTAEKPHPLQAAYVEEQVPQCGYCLNGWIMKTAALMAGKPHPTEDEIRSALSEVHCRCGTHTAIMRAIKRATQSA
jgi:nicotinate dehydrogenase subunit A